MHQRGKWSTAAGVIRHADVAIATEDLPVAKGPNPHSNGDPTGLVLSPWF